jgi:hypothetical protein
MQAQVFAQGLKGGEFELLLVPLNPTSPLVTVERYVFSLAGSRLLYRQTTLHLFPLVAGGGVEVADGSDAGWILLSGTSVSGPTICGELASYSQALHMLWRQYIRGVDCGEASPSVPAESGNGEDARVLANMSSLDTQALYFYGDRGRTIWSSVLATGGQVGLDEPPLLGVSNNALCVAGFSNGPFVGESLSTSHHIYYAYLARLSLRSGALLWKARVVTQVTDNSSVWGIYLPRSLSCTNRGMEVWDPYDQGSNTPGLPTAILISASEK